jgi:hypothetical protein
MTRYLLPLVFHSLPLVTLYLGWYYGTAAMVLGVAVPYIKVAKLSAFAERLVAGRPLGADGEAELAGLEVAIRRWRQLTFLKVSPPAAS